MFLLYIESLLRRLVAAVVLWACREHIGTRRSISTPMQEEEHVRHCRYTLLIDSKAAENLERLRRTYDLSTWACVFELGIRLLTWITNQNSCGYDAPVRARVSETGHIESIERLELPYAVNYDAWRGGYQT